VQAGSFSTLIAAAEAAGLVETLRGTGPYTVFAPTDEAFAALPEGTVETLLSPENRDQLVAILSYHVVPGRITLNDLSDDLELSTVQGSSARVERDGELEVQGARIVAGDIEATNGIIHVIDEVMLPGQ
jgi:uncharacterized surface protein with fasciclin (FAS1) repeats